jgi:hypothetical protein
VDNCGLVCCSWFSIPNEGSATSVTHHWKGIFPLSQKSESEFLFRALTGPQWRRQFRRIRSGASERDGESMTCYTSLERKFQMQSIHRATISVAATRTGTNRSQTQRIAADQNLTVSPDARESEDRNACTSPRARADGTVCCRNRWH